MDDVITATVLRQTSRRRVFQYIYNSSQPVTRKEIAEELSLSVPTITGSLSELVELGLVSCSDVQVSTEERKPRTYALEPLARGAVGLSILDNEVRILAIDMRANELGFRALPLPFTHTASYYETLTRCLEEFLDDLDLDRSRLLGVGITLPGIIDQEAGKVVMAPTLDLWDVSLDEIYPYFSRYHSFIENDANASGCAERWMDKSRSNMVYLYLERGVGGAIFWDNKQYIGDRGRGGEFGHLCIVPNGKLCHCGRRGCLEAYCSTSRLSDDLGVTLEEFFAALRGGDEQAAAIWAEYCDHLTDALNNLRTNFDCDIVLGGTLSSYLGDLFPELCWELGEKTLFNGDSSFLHLDRFGAHSACAGTALRFIDDYLCSI